MARHRRSYDVFIDVWGSAHGDLAVYDRAKIDEAVAAELRRFSELETAEEEAFDALLATRPTTKAGAIACVEHVADYGLITNEVGAWLLLMLESPLVS
jgi:hypothetical protein